METTEAVLLITLINIIVTGVVGGFIIYRIQKKIDATFQKSVFEYQTKYSRNYPKTLETLETLREKFAIYVRSCIRAIANEDINQRENILKNLEDFYGYFSDHRMYISESLVSEINQIFQKSLEVYGDAVKKFGIPEKHVSLVENVNELDQQIKAIEKIYQSVADIKG